MPETGMATEFRTFRQDSDAPRREPANMGRDARRVQHTAHGRMEIGRQLMAAPCDTKPRYC